MIKPVIMAGGSGTRLWPLSRAEYPKQFLKINSDQTMIQNTILRLNDLDVEKPITLCGEDHRFIVAEQLRAVDKLGPIILEPEGRNTAPAIALAALTELNNGEDPLLLVLAADHEIGDAKSFVAAVTKAEELAELGKFVTFGVVPTHAETGYGYIKKGAKSIGCNGGTYSVDSFKEKPDEETAKQYLDCGEYLWNSGMFMFKASRYIEELEKFQLDIVRQCRLALNESAADLDFIRINKQAFMDCPSDSIDYAIMEPLCTEQDSDSVVVVPLSANWSDIGSFSAIWDVSDKDEQQNVVKGDVVLDQSQNNLILAENTLVTAVGLENTIVIQTKDAVLVANKDKVQDVKNIVAKLKKDNRIEANFHRQVFRPWGSYDGVDYGERYQVKHIIVNPGEKLSIQMHHHRAEHWIVVSGAAKVTNGDDTFLLTENQSTYIPIGTVHALENPGLIPIHLIEVQTGGYLGEDDIVRLEDRYGRIKEHSDK